MAKGKKPEGIEAGAFRPAIQNFGEFRATGIAPKSSAGFKGLSSAAQSGTVQVAPGFYSLDVRSNVPFVILKGPARQQKSLSWGETVAIPEGMAATIFNDSYHPGDIIIVGGQDWPTVPKRITVPVQFTVIDLNQTTWSIVPQWPVDVRRARQAFLMWNVVNTAKVVFTVTGNRKEGSHLTPSQVSGAGYTDVISRAASSLNYIPLGYGTIDTPLGNLLPHALLDTAIVGSFDVLKADVLIPSNVPMYYLLEY